ncbi:MAG: hypothetical protein HUK21_05270 [Fibrobacteraceae bacterium]|nr:hypothetical protein [Fibrobacteraceae bacterium]
MNFVRKILLIPSFCSSIFALTLQDLEQMKEELKNPISLEAIDSIFIEGEVAFKVENSQYTDRPSYQGVCTYRLMDLPIEVEVEFDRVGTTPAYGEKKIVRRVKYGSSAGSGHYDYDGRFKYDEHYWDKDEDRRNQIEIRIQRSNLILDKIDQLNLTCPYSTRCENGALQGQSESQFSEKLGSRGICNGKSVTKICNYRIDLDEGGMSDISVIYLNSGSNSYEDYTPWLMSINDTQKLDSVDAMKNSYKTIKIGKQEWMDHNLLYGEGLTGKYGVDTENYSNMTGLGYVRSIAMPSGEANGWFVMMDLNLRNRDDHKFLEKPVIKENHRGVCPVGFHVPTIKEWKELFEFVIKDKVKFPKFNLFETYEETAKVFNSNCSFYNCNPKGKNASKKMSKIHNELDATYSKWRRGREDGFHCENGKQCHFDLEDMRNVLLREALRNLCAKTSWPLDVNGEDVCLDSYGFSLPSNSITGNSIIFWTADASISNCHDIFEDGRHQCTYDINGYGFTIQMPWYNPLKFEDYLGHDSANLRCLKNKGRK